jgi:RimJ/RimL family protein N-acetyltransferase
LRGASVSTIVTRPVAPASLSTARLLLRQWRASDRAPFATLNADRRVMQYFPSPLAHADSDAFADRCERALNDRGWGLWAVEIPGRAPFIGFIGLATAGPGLPCSGLVEVGWRLAAPHWGQGYASEGARAALRHGFDVLDLPEIVSFTATLNRRSQAVMERMGMHRDPIEFDHPRVPEGSPLRRHVLYWLSRDEWRLAQAAPRSGAG